MYLPMEQSAMTANSIGDDLVTAEHMFFWFAAIFRLRVSVFMLMFVFALNFVFLLHKHTLTHCVPL